MSISVQCSACDKKLKVKDELADKRVKCPSCGQFIVVLAAPGPKTTNPSRKSKSAAASTSAPRNKRVLWPWFVGGGGIAVLCLAIGMVFAMLGRDRTPAKVELASEVEENQQEIDRKQKQQAAAALKAKQDEDGLRAYEIVKKKKLVAEKKKAEEDQIKAALLAVEKKKEEERTKVELLAAEKKNEEDRIKAALAAAKDAVPPTPDLTIECPTVKSIEFQPSIDVIGNLAFIPIRYVRNAGAGPLECRVVAAMVITENGAEKKIAFAKDLKLPADRAGDLEAIYVTLGSKQVKANDKLAIHLESPEGIISNTLLIPVTIGKRTGPKAAKRLETLKSAGMLEFPIGAYGKGTGLQGEFSLDRDANFYTGSGLILLSFRQTTKNGWMLLEFKDTRLDAVHVAMDGVNFYATARRYFNLDLTNVPAKGTTLDPIPLTTAKVGDWVSIKVSAGKEPLTRKMTLIAKDETSATLKTEFGPIGKMGKFLISEGKVRVNPLSSYSVGGAGVERQGLKIGKDTIEIKGRKVPCDWMEYKITVEVFSGKIYEGKGKLWTSREVPLTGFVRDETELNGKTSWEQLDDYGYAK